MSLDAMRWAMVQCPSKSVYKFVLVVMADRADEANCCFPSIKRLCLDTMQDRKTVIAGLQCLVEQGLIRDTGRRKGHTGKVKVYQLVGVPDRHAQAVAMQDSKQRSDTNEPADGPVRKKGAVKPVSRAFAPPQKGNGAVNGMIPSVPPNGTVCGTLNSPVYGTQNLSVESINEPISLQRAHAKPEKQKTEKNKTPETQLRIEKYKGIKLKDLPDGLSLESAKHFIDHRRTIKKPLTQHGFVLYLKALQRCVGSGLTLDQIVDETIDAGWQSVKPDWLNNRLKSSNQLQGYHNSAEDNRPRKELCA